MSHLIQSGADRHRWNFQHCRIGQNIQNRESIRHPHSQNIVSGAGDFIGANMKEALAWFKNPDNGDMRTAYENQLKLA